MHKISDSGTPAIETVDLIQKKKHTNHQYALEYILCSRSSEYKEENKTKTKSFQSL